MPMPITQYGTAGDSGFNNMTIRIAMMTILIAKTTILNVMTIILIVKTTLSLLPW